MKQIQAFFDSEIFPLVNSGVSPLIVTQKCAIAAQVNHFRLKKGLRTVPWDGVHFAHDYHKFGSSEEKKALVLGTLNEEARQTFAPLFDRNHRNEKTKSLNIDTKYDAELYALIKRKKWKSDQVLWLWRKSLSVELPSGVEAKD